MNPPTRKPARSLSARIRRCQHSGCTFKISDWIVTPYRCHVFELRHASACGLARATCHRIGSARQARSSLRRFPRRALESLIVE